MKESVESGMKVQECSEVDTILNNLKYSQVSITCYKQKFQATVKAVDLRPFTAKARAPPQANLCGPRFPPTTSVSPSQCHSTNASHSFTDLSPKLIISAFDSVLKQHTLKRHTV
jgi:hypothetical protein